MVASVLILIISVILMAYWFRYSCLLLLQQRASAAKVDSRFRISSIQQGLSENAPLDPLHRALDADYALLTFLVNHAAGVTASNVEDRLLVLDYSCMKLWYRLTKAVSPGCARRALAEMADVLAVLAQRVGDQTSAYTGA